MVFIHLKQVTCSEAIHMLQCVQGIKGLSILQTLLTTDNNFTMYLRARNTISAIGRILQPEYMAG